MKAETTNSVTNLDHSSIKIHYHVIIAKYVCVHLGFHSENGDVSTSFRLHWKYSDVSLFRNGFQKKNENKAIFQNKGASWT